MDLKLSSMTNSLQLENGDLALTSGQDSIAQFIKQKIRLFLSEWFLDETKGVPYFDVVFVKNPNSIVIDTIFKNLILSTPGVNELVEFEASLNKQTRVFTLRFVARTIGDDEPIIFEETLPL